MKVSLKDINTLVKSLPKRSLEDLLYDYFDDHADKTKKPKIKSKHIGLEIECFSRLSALEVHILKNKLKLDKWLSIGSDSSIEHNAYEAPYEFRILMKQSEMKSVLSKLSKFFKVGKFKVNDSCGMHVHLDMRNRDHIKSYNKLVKFEDVLFSLVDPQRWDNSYCYHTQNSDVHQRKAINLTAYRKYKTIEVRLHESCLDMGKVGNWINLLTTIVDSSITSKISHEITKLDEVLDLKWRDKSLKSYIAKTINNRYFTWKNRYDEYNDEVDQARAS